MSCNNRKSICVLVLLVAWSQRTRSQDDVTPAQPSDTFVNGHIASSVRTLEEQVKLDGVTGYVDALTGAPVQVPVGQPVLPGDEVADERPPGSPVVPGELPAGITGFVNAPTGISVEAREHRPDAIRGLVNGPTGISVETEEEQRSSRVTDHGDGSTTDLAEVAENQGSEGIAGPDDGTAGTTPEEEQMSDVSVPTAIPEEGEELMPGGVMGFVNGPTGTSIKAEEELMSGRVGSDAGEPLESSVGAKKELSKSRNRGVLSTAPEERQRMKQKLPAGLHIDTADWSKDSAHYSFKGGEWSLVDLPDAAHPTIPAPVVPGPALVVVTKNYLKKVHVLREVAGLANVTLHYRFFLTEGEAPNGIPELKVYQVVGGSSWLLATETTRGAWSDRTVHLSESGPFTIIFEGRLIKEGNEIAIDDVTISGISDGADDNTPGGGDDDSDAAVATPSDHTDINTEGASLVPAPSEVPLHGNETLDILEEAQKGATTGDTRVPAVDQGTPSGPTEIPDTASELPNKTEAAAGGRDVIEASPGVGLDTPSGEMDKAEGGAGSRDNMTLLIPTPSDAITVDEESVSRANETAPLSSMPESIGLTEEKSISPLTTDGMQIDGKNETDLPTLHSEMVNTMVSQGNNTEGLLETTFPSDGTRVPEVNMSIATDPQSSTVNSSNITPEETSPIILTTPSSIVEEVSRENFTQSSTFAQTSEISQATSTTNEEYSIPVNTSGGSQETTGTPGLSQPPVPTILGTSDTSAKTNVVTFTSASPSENDITTAPGASGTMPVTRTPWGVFQVFLVLCVLGFVVLGFLYWRKKRRQDDEIPVFTRSSHADYLNPTFSAEDDSSFASYGGRHNYKSFE